jgi:hypothetical protein
MRLSFLLLIALARLSAAQTVLADSATKKIVLDTMRIVAIPRDANMRGFEERRRASIGRYITAADVARKQPTVTSELFNMIPGLRLDRSTMAIGPTLIRMRSTFDPYAGGFDEWCAPGIYVDGAYRNDLNADDVDNIVNPNEIAGIEVYAGGFVPAQFSTGMGGVGRRTKFEDTIKPCGSIVIWTKPRQSTTHASWRRNLVRVTATVGFALIVIPTLRR